MTSIVEERRKIYEDKFKPEEYRDKREAWAKRRGSNLHNDGILPTLFIHNVFRDPKITGTTMLDIGSGPTVHNLIPACFRYSHIVLSDILLSNREALEKWLRNDPVALDWPIHLTNAVKLCGYEDLEKGRTEVEELIRRKVKSVIHCDVLAKEIVAPEYHVPYDLVLVRSVLECACPDYTTYQESVKKINPLVKLGGFFILGGYLNCPRFTLGEISFPVLCITYDEVSQALENAGFADLDWQIKHRRQDELEYPYDAAYCVRCTKIKDV